MDYQDSVVVLETNVDDSTGEVLGYVLDLLLEQGALDVSYTPIYMKKNRPAYEVKVICKPEVEETLISILFRETGAIGLRRQEMDRVIMQREAVTVDTPYGPVAAKKCTYKEVEKITVEYEDAKRVAKEAGVPLKDILK